MKKIVLSIFFISILFFGCKSTDNISQSNLPENQSELNTTVSEVEPVEPQSNDEEKSTLDSENLTDEGDLPLPLYDEFIPLIDEDEFTDEIFYGEDFLPQDKIEEDSMQNLQENLLQENNLTENILPEEILDFNSVSEIEISEKPEDLSYPDKTELTQNEEIENNHNENIVKRDIIQNNISNKNDVSDVASKNPEELIDSKTEVSKTNLQDKNDTKKTETSIFDSTVTSTEPISTPNSTSKDDFEVLPENTDEVFTESNFVEESPDEEQNFADEIIPSRTVYASKNQIINVPYPGTGWVYLGEIESKALVSFKGKTFSGNITNFVLTPQREGKTILHFYKLDAINGKYIDDYLEVIITPSLENNLVANSVTAPDYNYEYYLMNDFNKKNSDENSDNTEEIFNDDSNVKEKSNEQDSTVQQNDISVVESEKENLNTKEIAEVEVVEEEPELMFLSDIFDDETESQVDESFDSTVADVTTIQPDFSDTSDLLAQAKKYYENKEYTNALLSVNKFLETSNEFIDEALYLKGQILEKPFELRNIKDALDCYKIVISSYPQSNLWDKCDERIKYIQRFYFNIR